MSKLKTLKGLSLQDILAEVHHYVHKLDLPAQVAPFFSTEYLLHVFQVRIHLLIKMAELEARLMAGATEKIQLGSFLAMFQVSLLTKSSIETLSAPQNPESII